MYTVFKARDGLFVLHLGTVHHGGYPTEYPFLIFIILFRFYFERWPERFKVEGSLDKLILRNFVYDGDEVLDEVIIENVLGLELGETFGHNRSPFLNELEVYRWGDKAYLAFS